MLMMVMGLHDGEHLISRLRGQNSDWGSGPQSPTKHEPQELVIGTSVFLRTHNVDEVVDAVLHPVDAVQHYPDLWGCFCRVHFIDDGYVVDADRDDAHKEHEEELHDDAGRATST